MKIVVVVVNIGGILGYWNRAHENDGQPATAQCRGIQMLGNDGGVLIKIGRRSLRGNSTPVKASHLVSLMWFPKLSLTWLNIACMGMRVPRWIGVLDHEERVLSISFMHPISTLFSSYARLNFSVFLFILDSERYSFLSSLLCIFLLIKMYNLFKHSSL